MFNFVEYDEIGCGNATTGSPAWFLCMKQVTNNIDDNNNKPTNCYDCICKMVHMIGMKAIFGKAMYFINTERLGNEVPQFPCCKGECDSRTFF